MDRESGGPPVKTAAAAGVFGTRLVPGACPGPVPWNDRDPGSRADRHFRCEILPRSPPGRRTQPGRNLPSIRLRFPGHLSRERALRPPPSGHTFTVPRRAKPKPPGLGRIYRARRDLKPLDVCPGCSASISVLSRTVMFLRLATTSAQRRNYPAAWKLSFRGCTLIHRRERAPWTIPSF